MYKFNQYISLTVLFIFLISFSTLSVSDEAETNKPLETTKYNLLNPNGFGLISGKKNEAETKQVREFISKTQKSVIDKFKNSELSKQDLMTKVFVLINTKKLIEKVNIIQSSGNETFDDFVINEILNNNSLKSNPETPSFERPHELNWALVITDSSPQIKRNPESIRKFQPSKIILDYEKHIVNLIQDQLDTYGIKNPFLSTEIRLELSRFGEIKALDIQHSSSDPWFDKRVIAAVNRAAPFFSVPLANKDYKKVRSLDLSIKNLKPMEKPVEQLVN